MKKHLNFIPKDMKAKWEVRHELVPLALFAALVFYAGAGPVRLSVLTQISEKEIAQLEATSNELNEKLKAMNEQSKVAEQNNESLSAIQQVLARKNYWSEVFKEMSILVPEDVWLTNFSNMKTGGKAPGMAADANNRRRTRSSEFGWPLAAIAPIFQAAGNCASISEVPISNSRPRS